jgi:hypothetical protein
MPPKGSKRARGSRPDAIIDSDIQLLLNRLFDDTNPPGDQAPRDGDAKTDCE